MTEKSESIVGLSKLALPALYLPWKMFMGLQAGKVQSSVRGSAQSRVAVLSKPPQECASFSAGFPQHAAIRELEEKCVKARRESDCSPGGKENLTCNY